MQTVSKTYGAADAEAQEPALKPQGLSRAAVASICFAAALSGAAVASVARVRTRTYAADLYAGLGGTAYGPDQLNMKQCGPSGKVCQGTSRCYEKVKDDGTTKYKCAEIESLSNSWEIAAASRGTSRAGTMSKKKAGGNICNSKKYEGKDMCGQGMAPVCDDNDVWASSECNYCINNKAYTGSFRSVPTEDGPDACKK